VYASCITASLSKSSLNEKVLTPHQTIGEQEIVIKESYVLRCMRWSLQDRRPPPSAEYDCEGDEGYEGTEK